MILARSLLGFPTISGRIFRPALRSIANKKVLDLPRLVLMRHGTTVWAETGRFAGWGDAPLSAAGEALARKAGRLLKRKSFAFDVCFTSRLIRAQETVSIVLEEMEIVDIPLESGWKLNERHYGMLQEKSRKAIADHYGSEAMVAWRRDYRARPPALSDDDPRWHEQKQRFQDVPEEDLPRSESLEDGVLRVEAFWKACLSPVLRSGKNMLVVAHTCSIRSLVKSLDGLSDEQAEAFRIPPAIPLVYELNDDLSVLRSYRLINDRRTWWRNTTNRYKPRWMYRKGA